MEELKVLYKELQEIQKHLENTKKTKITEGRISENLLTIVRVQQLLIPLVVGQSEQLVCGCSQGKGVDIDEDGFPYCIDCQKNVAK